MHAAAKQEQRGKQVEDKQVSIPFLKKVLQRLRLRAVTAGKHCSLNFLILLLGSFLCFLLYPLQR